MRHEFPILLFSFFFFLCPSCPKKITECDVAQFTEYNDKRTFFSPFSMPYSVGIVLPHSNADHHKHVKNKVNKVQTLELTRWSCVIIDSAPPQAQTRVTNT